MTSPRRKKKKKEEILFEYIRHSNSKAIQLLNCIWLYCFYKNIKTLGKDVRELQNGKGNGPLLVKYLLTLRININDAYDYFQALLSTALKIYEEKKDEYILHLSKVEGRRNDYFGQAPLSDVHSGDAHLRDLSFGEDSHVNNAIDIFYARHSARGGEQSGDQSDGQSDGQSGDQSDGQRGDRGTSPRGEGETLHGRLEIARICVSNLFKILGDLHRYKCYFFEENKKKNEKKACLNYYKALGYYRYSGHLFNQLTLLYTGGNPIKCLFFYFLSLIAVKPAPNRDAVVMFMESVLSGGRGLASRLARLRGGSPGRNRIGGRDGSGGSGGSGRQGRCDSATSTPCRGETSCKLGRGIFYIKTKERHFLPSMKGSEDGAKEATHHQRGSHHDRMNPRVAKKHTEVKKEGSTNSGERTSKENPAEKDLNEAIFNFYMSYFKIVKLLFSKINMNKFEKKKNKFIYYTNRYIKLQYYSRREDTLMLKNIIFIIFTLLSLVIHIVANQHEKGLKKQGLAEQGLAEQGLAEQGLTKQGLAKQGHTKQGHTKQGHTKQGHTNQGGFFFYGGVNVSKYVYKHEQIYFSFLLIHELLLSCEEFYTNFFPSYLSVFIYTLYWFRNEPSVWEVHVGTCTEEDNRERDHLVKQYHEDYRGKSVYGRRPARCERATLHPSAARRPPWGRSTGEPHSAKRGSYSQAVEDPCDDPQLAQNKDIIQSIKDLLIGIKVREEVPLNDNSLLRYKLGEDFCIYPFLSGLQFSSLEGGGGAPSVERGCRASSSQWSGPPNVACQEGGPNRGDKQCSQLPCEQGTHRRISHLTNFEDSNEEDVVLLKNPLFVKASGVCINGEVVDPRGDASKGLHCYHELYDLSAVSGNNAQASEREDAIVEKWYTGERAPYADASQGRNSSRGGSSEGVVPNTRRMAHSGECSQRDHYIAAVDDIPNDEHLEEVADRVRIMRFRSLTQGGSKGNDHRSVHVGSVCKGYSAEHAGGEVPQGGCPSAEGITDVLLTADIPLTADVPHAEDVPLTEDCASRGKGCQEHTSPIGAELCKNEMSCTMSRSDDDNKTSNVMSDHPNGAQDKSDGSGSYKVHPNGEMNQSDYFNYAVLESFHQVRVDALGSISHGVAQNDGSCKHVLGGELNSSSEMTKGSDEANSVPSLGASLEDISEASSPFAANCPAEANFPIAANCPAEANFPIAANSPSEANSPFAANSPSEANSPFAANPTEDEMTKWGGMPFQANDPHKGEGQTQAPMVNPPGGAVHMERTTFASCKRGSSPSRSNHVQPPYMHNGSALTEEGAKCESSSLQTKMVILDGKNIGTRYQDNYKKYFDPFRIKVVLNYYRFKRYDVKVVIPQEYVRHEGDAPSGKTANRGYYHLQVHSSNEGADFILSGDDLLFFQHLHILGCLIIHPLESYYAFCVNLVQRWNSCFVTNVTLSELNMQVGAFEQPPLKGVAAHFISYTFLGDEFLPNPTFRWPSHCKREAWRVSRQARLVYSLTAFPALLPLCVPPASPPPVCRSPGPTEAHGERVSERTNGRANVQAGVSSNQICLLSEE
ncbi:tetratricopeptide repeat protein, putative [Plasmodium vivax]|nr:tetratricopeptide repeat protein, putative [Plasmodium vivax]